MVIASVAELLFDIGKDIQYKAAVMTDNPPHSVRL